MTNIPADQLQRIAAEALELARQQGVSVPSTLDTAKIIVEFNGDESSATVAL